MLKPDDSVRTVLAKALITRFSPLRGTKIAMSTARRYVPTTAVLQWGQIRVTEGRDTMCCCEMIKPELLGRDCTYIRVSFFTSYTMFCNLVLARL